MSRPLVYSLLLLFTVLSVNQQIANASANTQFTIILLIFFLSRNYYCFSNIELIAIGLILDIVRFMPLGLHSIALIIFIYTYHKIREIILASNWIMLLVSQNILVIVYMSIYFIVCYLLEFNLSILNLLTNIFFGFMTLLILNSVSNKNIRVRL